ncbi:efflux RND transporter periplasmic adaptor subunit [Terasakiella sp.]|uniref:efflux RND transporter periplasmic adaptor subunit n=1 Tax=Terasakiella sp. TaxID=2034861 RepID=UPI003AA8FC11
MKFLLNKSVMIAIGIAAVVSIWLLSGLFTEKEEVAAKSVVETHTKNKVNVLVSTQEAHDHADIISLYGQTEANRDVELKAQTKGRISELLIEKGTVVSKGDVIARIAMDDRKYQLEGARAAVRFRELEYDASKKLSQKSFRSQTKLAESKSLLNSARADLENIRLDIEHTEIKAPFDGYLENTSIEVGDFVDSGDPIAKIVDLSPIVVSAAIPEYSISKIKDGQAARAVLNDGRILEGIVRFIAATSDNSTRTYRVEMEAPNDAQELINVGITAKLQLSIGRQHAYQVSPAILTLSDEGVIGIKTVDDANKVVFHPVKLLEDTPEGIWITGLPQTARIITRGQEYVSVGQEVITTQADDEQKANVDEQPSAPAIAKAQEQ